MEDTRTSYEKRIQSRSYFHYLIGLSIRWWKNVKYGYARRVARRRGATIGEDTVLPLALAKVANKNLIVGSHTSIQSSTLDLRAPIHIGDHVIIGSDTKIITVSHDIDDPEWSLKNYGITICDYAWIPTNILILPSCRKVGYGAVISSGSVVVKDVEEMSVVSGNPAKEFKKRQCVHSKLVVESLLSGDYHQYKRSFYLSRI